ncbi:MAG: histidine kinase [Lachnospiraceae bacterium]|nr:histidine kinase [Lachnospiraceae bacterium]
MENLEAILNMLDYSLNTKSKRHIAGGILLSISLLFGGLAFTTMTLKQEESE